MGHRCLAWQNLFLLAFVPSGLVRRQEGRGKVSRTVQSEGKEAIQGHDSALSHQDCPLRDQSLDPLVLGVAFLAHLIDSTVQLTQTPGGSYSSFDLWRDLKQH